MHHILSKLVTKNTGNTLVSGALRDPWPFCHLTFRPNNGHQVKDYFKNGSIIYFGKARENTIFEIFRK